MSSTDTFTYKRTITIDGKALHLILKDCVRDS